MLNSIDHANDFFELTKRKVKHVQRMDSISLNLTLNLLNYTHKGLSSAENPFGKLVRIVSDDVRSLESMRMTFLD